MAGIIDQLSALINKHVIVYVCSGETTFPGVISAVDGNCLVLTQAGTQKALLNIDNVVAVIHSEES